MTCRPQHARYTKNISILRAMWLRGTLTRTVARGSRTPPMEMGMSRRMGLTL